MLFCAQCCLLTPLVSGNYVAFFPDFVLPKLVIKISDKILKCLANITRRYHIQEDDFYKIQEVI